MKSPIGIDIAKHYRVGQKIGSGNCATVYDLVDRNGNPTEFAIKMAPLPKKGTQEKKSPAEINANLIWYEHMLYQLHFGKIQGTFIPMIPSKPKLVVHGRTNEYIYFVMERMESSLASIVPLLLQNKSSSKTISVGPIAAKLVACIHAVHECNHVVRDVKTSNFMLAPGEGNGATLEAKLSCRIRLLDLALAVFCNNKRLEQGGMVGTPLYASLNVHASSKGTRRDDLEAIGYVVAELLTQLSSGDPSKQLPWSHGESDKEIGEIKLAMVSDPDSLFYKQLGDDKTISVFSKYLATVRGYSFDQEPDYEELAKLLEKLVVPRAMVPLVASKTSPCRTSVRKAAEAGTMRVLTPRTVAKENEATQQGDKNPKLDFEEGYEAYSHV